MIRAPAIRRLFATRLSRLPQRSFLPSPALLSRSTHAFPFSEGKGSLPRNKEEAWMMQEQQKVKDKPKDEQEDDGSSYKGYSKYGIGGLAIMAGAFAILINRAEQKSDEQMDFFEEPIAGLKQEKEEKVEIGGDWTLIDSQGRPFSNRTLAGYYYLVYFGFTRSPDVCPNTLYYLSTVYRVIRNMPEGAYLKLKVVFVSIDPERDSPEGIKDYLANFGKNIIGLTGNSADDIELKQCMKKFKVKSRKVYKGENKEKYDIDYVTQVFLMDPDNQYMYHIDPTLTEQQAAKAIVAKIVSNQHLKEKMLSKAAAS